MSDAPDQPRDDTVDRPRRSLARDLGAFFGHVWHGLRTDPSRTEVRREVEEERRSTSRGEVTLRRTTIEEIRFERDRRSDDRAR